MVNEDNINKLQKNATDNLIDSLVSRVNVLNKKVDDEWEAPLVDLIQLGFFDEIIKMIRRTHKQAGKKRISMLVIWGYTDTGKTTLGLNYVEAVKRIYENDKRVMRILSPTNGRWKDILIRILKECYHFPASESMKEPLPVFPRVENFSNLIA